MADRNHWLFNYSGSSSGTIPYIALQLKAVGQTFNIMAGAPTATDPTIFDTAFFAALFLTVFAILFGTRLPGRRRDSNRG